MNVLEENEKLASTTCTILTYTAMKDTLKKMFSAIKEEVETVIFNQYWSSIEEKAYQGNKTNPIDIEGKIIGCFKCN